MTSEVIIVVRFEPGSHVSRRRLDWLAGPECRGFPHAPHLTHMGWDRLRSRSCIIDGEAVACDDNGVASFDLIRHHRANDSVFLYAFALLTMPARPMLRFERHSHLA
jgi:hypothetical protein